MIEEPRLEEKKTPSSVLVEPQGLSCSEGAANSCSDLFGTPGSPPSTPSASTDTSQPRDFESLTNIIDESDELYSIDSVAMQHDLDVQMNFNLDNGTYQTGDALTTCLKEYNKKLSKRVKIYRNECEHLKKRLSRVERDTSSKIESIRSFCRNMLY